MDFNSEDKTYRFQRVPHSGNNTLREWSAADELLLAAARDTKNPAGKILICHDRFGFLATVLANRNPVSLLISHAQSTALELNFKRNQPGLPPPSTVLPLEPVENVSAAMIHIPKSLELFEFYIWKAAASLQQAGKAYAGFMTRHFTPAMLEIAGKYFTEVNQSRAWKKARTLELSGPKPGPEPDWIREFEIPGLGPFRQYPGVFSAGQVDNATRFLLEHLPALPAGGRVLDLACGNGVIGLALRNQSPEAEIHFLDDYWLALKSAEMNAGGQASHFHWEHDLSGFEPGQFDLVITNPPFHFEYEIDISIPIGLFRQVTRVLRPGGELRIVANRHLNYGTHLSKIFPVINTIAENEKFEILSAVNSSSADEGIQD